MIRRRKSLGMTQTAVAALAGIDQSSLSAIERGKVDARLSTLLDIVRALRSELVLVPGEDRSAIQSLVGGAPTSVKRPLFEIDPD